MYRLKMVKINKNQKGQSFSADVLIVVVLVLFGALFIVMNQINEQREADLAIKAEEAEQQSKILFDSFKDSEVIDFENNLNMEMLMSMDQDELRNTLGVRNDFAVVFEKEGYLIKIDPDNNITCLGSSKIVVNGVPCR